MPKLRFEQLLGLYRAIDFDPTGDQGSLVISTQEQLADLQFIETDEAAGEDANLAVLGDPTTLAVGQTIRLRVGPPRIGLGLLARSFDDLLKASEARIAEPKAYFVVNGKVEPQTSPEPVVIAYRKVLGVVDLLAKAAAYLDPARQELVFVHDGKVVVPVRYDAPVLSRISGAAIDALLDNFKDDVHQDQKLAILENAVVKMVEGQPAANRFTYVLDNISALTETVRQGYKLFASSFSYTKIKGEVEAAKVDYVAKIHKTLIDIQGQLLGIPVATIIVASQLKASRACGVEFWTNIAVLAGAWVFLALLLISIINQWLTLSAIAEDIRAQTRRLERDYAAISGQFLTIFESLTGRIRWHRGALIGIGIVAAAGALFATFAFSHLTAAPLACFGHEHASSHPGVQKAAGHSSAKPSAPAVQAKPPPVATGASNNSPQP